MTPDVFIRDHTVLVAPALVQAGIDPMAAHLFILYYGMLSMITPPVCVGAAGPRGAGGHVGAASP